MSIFTRLKFVKKVSFSVVELAVFLYVFIVRCYKVVLFTLLIRSRCFKTAQNVAIQFRGDSERYKSENVKKNSTNSVLSFDDVLNDINDWLAEENGEKDEIGDNLDDLYGEEEEIDTNPSQECLEEEQQSEEPEDNGNRQQRYRPRKQLTRSRNVRDIGSSLDENKYKEIVYMNKDGVFYRPNQ